MSAAIILIREALPESLSKLSSSGLNQIQELAGKLQFADLVPSQILSGTRGPSQLSAIQLCAALGHEQAAVIPCQKSTLAEPDTASDPETLRHLADLARSVEGPIAVVSTHHYAHQLSHTFGRVHSLGSGEALLIPVTTNGIDMQSARHIGLVTSAPR